MSEIRKDFDMKKAAFYTLGCKVNQYETEAMSELFEKSGYEIVAFEEYADVYVVNTCTVTGMSDRKSRQIIRRAKRLNPHAIAVVTGCYAQTAPDAALKIDGVNLVVGTQDRKNIVSLVESITSDSSENAVRDIMHTREFEDLSVKTYKNRTRAYIKIQEGCNQFCSYCIIPYARGPVRSRPCGEVIAEVERLAEEGFTEVILAGIHVASYGIDLGDCDLAKLIRHIDKIEKIRRIRLSSIEPMTLDESFIENVKSCKKLCRHFHISLQSGCDETLKRMNRKYTGADYEKIVNGLRKNYPDVAITTDIMVGFPGETDEEFRKTCEFVEKIAFADAHVFQYSRRNGTPAAARPGQIPSAEKEKRSKKIIEITKKSQEEYFKKFVGTYAEVLFEQPCHRKDGYFEGKTDNYLTVAVPSDANLSGEYHKVLLTEATDFGLTGKIEV